MYWWWWIAYLDGVPVLAGEGVDGSLLETLLALRQSLVPIDPKILVSCCHVSWSCLSPSSPGGWTGGGGMQNRAGIENGEDGTHLPTAIFARVLLLLAIQVGTGEWCCRKDWWFALVGLRLSVVVSMGLGRRKE